MVDDKSAAEKSDNNENNSDADSVEEPIDDSDADKDWEPKEVSEPEADEQDELEMSSEDESAKELTQIEKKSGHVPDSDGDVEKQEEYDEGSISDIVPDTPPRPKLTPVKTSQTKTIKSQGGNKISSPSSTEKTSENVSKKNSSTKSTANVTKSTVSSTGDTSEKTMPGSTIIKSAVSANTPKRPSRTSIKPMKVKLFKTITPLSQSSNAKKKVSQKTNQYLNLRSLLPNRLQNQMIRNQ